MKRICVFLLVVVGIFMLCIFCTPIATWAQDKNSGPSDEAAPPPPPPPSGSILKPPSDDTAPPPPPVDPIMEPGHGEIQQSGVLMDSIWEFGVIQISERKLLLSPPQSQQIQQEYDTFQGNISDLKQEIQFMEQEFQVEMLADTADREKIDTLLDKILTLNQQIDTAATENFLKIKGVLTEAQQTHLINLQLQLPKEFKQIQFTPEQRSQIREIMKSSKRNTREITEKLDELKGELYEAVLAKQIDLDKINQLQVEIVDREAILEKARIDIILQIKGLLTPEQHRQLLGTSR